MNNIEQTTSNFIQIVEMIQTSRSNAVRAVNAELVNLYWNVGAYVSHKLKQAEWGDKTVRELAVFIQQNYPDLKGFNRAGLYRMVQFYDTYALEEFVAPVVRQLQKSQSEIVATTWRQIKTSNDLPIVATMGRQLEMFDIRETILTKLSWSHHRIIFSRCKLPEEREFYIHLTVKENYTVRELDRQISSCLFERTMLGNKQLNLSPALQEFNQDLTNIFKDQYIFDFLNLPEPYNETDLQKGLVTQIKNFILELGKDFLFMGQEYKLMVGNSDFFIDLLFYHRALQCLVAFELKTDKFRPEHLGQLNFYLEALDRDVKRENENPSIGILLCKDKDNEVVEYALNRNLSPAMIAEYQMLLPDKALLQQKLHELLK
ncbi:hypothetical protein BMT54_07035 [Pasteurellaceae bacterium 15-036681]|nr:hypothetical protein BMT54_07035 [Pasteurellaceae bacterium 15-036681]